MNTWMKMGKGGSYSGYFKLRKEIGVVSPKQRAHRAKFRNAVLACKGKPKAEFRACVSQHMS